MMKRILVVLALAFCISATSAFALKAPGKALRKIIPSNTIPLKIAGGDEVAPKQVVTLKATAAAESSKEGKGIFETLEVGIYFALWYLFNIAYNIYNKQALNNVDFPWSVATIQMATGILYFVPLWLLGVRKAPKLNMSELGTLFPIALCHTGVHVGAVIALGAGAVSFAHIVKASEPVVTCALNALLLGQILPTSVYMTLIPIIAGVGLASLKELSFSFLALAAAMLSNVSSAARGVLSKKTMSGKKIGENLDPQNLYAVLTLISTFVLIPVSFAIEGTGFFSAFKSVVAKSDFTNKSLAMLLFLSGASYYAYNEVAFLALGKVNPVTHAVGNTIKRVVIIVASVVAFNVQMSTGSIIGSSIAIAGTLMYSLAMNAAKEKKA